MDGQPTTRSGSDTAKKMDRRRIAIAAALMMMGAVLIDPALLDDMNVSVQLSGKSPDGEPIDEFAQIELMLSQSENSSRTVIAPAVDETPLKFTQPPSVEPPESPQIASANVLMIPTESAPTNSIETMEAATSGSTESAVSIETVSNTHSVELPTTTSTMLMPPAAEPPQPSPVGKQSSTSQATIRLTGTIAPIQ